jgi:hypothetical protein
MLKTKRGRLFGALLASLVAASAGAAVPAHAAEQILCVITETITWNPPLKNEAQQVTFTTNGQLTGCNGLSATATYHETGTYPAATCNSLLKSGTGIRVWDWTAPGVPSSEFSYLVTGARVAGTIVAVATGPIISGAYTDSAARSVAVAPAPDVLACANEGVAQVVVAGTLTIGI